MLSGNFPLEKKKKKKLTRNCYLELGLIETTEKRKVEIFLYHHYDKKSSLTEPKLSRASFLRFIGVIELDAIIFQLPPKKKKKKIE